MTQHPLFGHMGWLLAALALGLGLTTAPGLAATEKAKKAAAVKKPGNTKFLPGSQETRKERTERLNAGACTGYTE